MSISVFKTDLEWAQQGHLFLSKYFYPQYAYKGQFVYCDRSDNENRGALLINKKCHIDTIVQYKTPLNAICIDEKIVKGYYDCFALETHSISPSPKLPQGLGDGCILNSWADELLYVFPTEKDCDCDDKVFQKCTHSILSAEAYLIHLSILVEWFKENYMDYCWSNVRNQGYWTHVRIVPIQDVYKGIGHQNISKIILSTDGLKNKVFYEANTKQYLLFPFENNTPFFQR